jgi:hypothetical protein
VNSHDVSETRSPPRGTTDKKMKNFRRSAPATLLCVYVEGRKVPLSNCLRFVMGRSLFAPSSPIPSRIFLANPARHRHAFGSVYNACRIKCVIRRKIRVSLPRNNCTTKRKIRVSLPRHNYTKRGKGGLFLLRGAVFR